MSIQDLAQDEAMIVFDVHRKPDMKYVQRNFLALASLYHFLFSEYPIQESLLENALA